MPVCHPSARGDLLLCGSDLFRVGGAGCDCQANLPVWRAAYTAVALTTQAVGRIFAHNFKGDESEPKEWASAGGWGGVNGGHKGCETQ